jgi:hypothetical protein
MCPPALGGAHDRSGGGTTERAAPPNPGSQGSAVVSDESRGGWQGRDPPHLGVFRCEICPTVNVVATSGLCCRAVAGGRRQWMCMECYGYRDRICMRRLRHRQRRECGLKWGGFAGTSSGLRCPSAAVPLAAHPVLERISSNRPTGEESLEALTLPSPSDGPFDGTARESAQLCFAPIARTVVLVIHDEHRSAIGEPPTQPRRRGSGPPTKCRRMNLSFRPHARRCR